MLPSGSPGFVSETNILSYVKLYAQNNLSFFCTLGLNIICQNIKLGT